MSEYERMIAYGGAVILMIVGISGLLGKYKPKRPSGTKINISVPIIFAFGSVLSY